MKYLYEARLAGTRVAVVNTYFEPGLQKYWVPSVPESAVFGTRFADDWFGVDTGGDLAFLCGVLKALIAGGGVDATSSRAPRRASRPRRRRSRNDLGAARARKRTARAEMERFARLLAGARNGIFVWSMGLTQHAHGVATIEALVNVGLARGWVGREKVGLMPIRGHSGVQGGAEVGCAPGLEEPQSTRFAEVWGFPCPSFKGLTAAEMVDAAYRGGLDVFWIVGGNFVETLPDPAAATAALRRVGTRIHQDIVLTSMMLLPAEDIGHPVPGHDALRVARRRHGDLDRAPHHLLARGAGTAIGSAKAEWEVFGEVASRVRPDRAAAVRFRSSQEIRDEIARRFLSMPASSASLAAATSSSGAGRGSSRTGGSIPGRQGPLLRGRAGGPGTAGGDVPRLHPPRQAVQLDGAA
jgi:anaerobic selenocysteine-containing dehydrogenase